MNITYQTKNFIKKILTKYYRHKYSSKMTFTGKNYKIGRHFSVKLYYGSKKEDIVIGDHCDLYGNLSTQSGGKIIVGDWVRIGANVRIKSVESVVLGDNVIISEGVTITDNNTHPTHPVFNHIRSCRPETSTMHRWIYSAHKPVIIGNNCWIAEFSRVCKGVTIGENSIVGANSVVTKDVPPNSIAVGNPAKVVKTDIDKMPIPTDCEEFVKLLHIENININA